MLETPLFHNADFVDAVVVHMAVDPYSLPDNHLVYNHKSFVCYSIHHDRVWVFLVGMDIQFDSYSYFFCYQLRRTGPCSGMMIVDYEMCPLQLHSTCE